MSYNKTFQQKKFCYFIAINKLQFPFHGSLFSFAAISCMRPAASSGGLIQFLNALLEAIGIPVRLSGFSEPMTCRIRGNLLDGLLSVEISPLACTKLDWAA